jgi:putative phage-type endonuclease
MKERKVENGLCLVGEYLKDVPEEYFRKARLTGFGGSDAGAIMGSSTYRSAFMVVNDKINPGEKGVSNKNTKRGKRMEPVIRSSLAEWIKEDQGIDITVFESPWQYRSVGKEFMIADIDGLVQHPEFGLILLEVKTATEKVGDKWDNDSVPDPYYAQVQHYMYVTGLRMCLVAVMIGLDFEYRYIPFNESFTIDMIKREENLWYNFVMKGLLPVPSGIDKENTILNDRYGNPTKETVDLPELSDEAEKYLYLNKQEKEIDVQKDAIAGKFKDALKDAKRCNMNGYYALWSRFDTTSFDSERFQAENPEMYQKYVTKSRGSRLMIKAVKDGKK